MGFVLMIRVDLGFVLIGDSCRFGVRADLGFVLFGVRAE